MIIDCHTHISQYGPTEHKTFEQVRDALLESMEANGVDHTIVYPDSESASNVSNLDTTPPLIDGQPSLSMLGTILIPENRPLDQAVLAKLAGLAADGALAGIKLYPGFEVFYPDDPRCHVIYDLCLTHDLPIIFHSGETMGEAWREAYNHPDEVAKVARRFPDLRVVIAHFSQPHLDACRQVILSHENLHADMSGLAHPEVVAACGADTIRATLIAVVEAQPFKVLFGTDWPMCDVQSHINLVRSLPVPARTQDMILAENAQRVFRLSAKENA